jgi:chromosomal replication initiation ATPase DnaA
MIDYTTIRPPLTAYRVVRTAEAIGHAFQVRPDAILSPNRGNAIIGAARLALYTLLYEQTNASLKEIGKRVGRDHTTVLQGIQRTESWPQIAPAWAAALEQMRRTGA